MKNKDKLIIKICKSVIVVFGVLTVFNVIMLVNKKSYALFQKTVKTDTVVHIETANEFPSESGIGTDVVKDTLGKDGGIKGVDPDNGTICENVEEECPEYRFVGTTVNNYVYFNCKPDGVQNNENCELWRIVGIFTDDNGEHLKIVKDKVLTANDFPTEYKKDTITYKIRGSGNYAYWNSGGKNNNDWATAGLQYWLNGTDDEGYLGKLKEGVIDKIADTKYYLGSVSSYSSNKDTPKTAYEHERAVEGCDGEVGPAKNNTSSAVESNADCRVWADNSATWTGKVGLLYPSDYGFSADETYWNSKLYNYRSASTSSWLQTTTDHESDDFIAEWFLSPSSSLTYEASDWNTNYVYQYPVGDSGDYVRPSLNLISDIEIIGGEGTQDNPYQLTN